MHAKADAETIAVLPALQHPNVTLLVDHEVTRLQTDAGGRTVTGVITQHGSAEEVFTADIVVVSAGATNSARLLLSSASDAHPNGLANGSDQVGRNYMFHNSKAVVALGKEPNETAFQKTLGLNDFYFGGPDFDFPLGNIQMVGKSNAEAMKGEEPHLTLLAPHWSLADVAAHAVDFWLTTEDLPRPENRVTLDGDGTVHLAYTATNDKEAERLYGELKKILNHVGMASHHVLEQELLHVDGHPGGRCGASGRHVPLRQRPRDLRARCELQGPRSGQPLRGRHQLLPEHRCREPRTDRHGQCHPCRRASDRAAGLSAAAGESAVARADGVTAVFALAMGGLPFVVARRHHEEP